MPRRRDYGRGSYRRCIVLDAAPGRATGELADDFHHFSATVEHDGRRVTAVSGEGVRVPWTTCPAAGAALERLVGAPLDRSLDRVAAHTDPRAQCTHWYDAACLAIVQAARHAAGGAATRRYDLVLPDRRDGTTRPTLARDGELVVTWRLEGLRIVAATPEVFAGLPLTGEAWRRGLAEDAAGALDEDLREAAGVMRRGVFIGLGRQYDFEAIERAASFAPVVGAACHTFSPPTLETARKVPGTVRDFHDAPERILDR